MTKPPIPKMKRLNLSPLTRRHLPIKSKIPVPRTINQAAISDELGVSEQSIHVWLTGKQPVPPNRQNQLAQAFDKIIVEAARIATSLRALNPPIKPAHNPITKQWRTGKSPVKSKKLGVTPVDL